MKKTSSPASSIVAKNLSLDVGGATSLAKSLIDFDLPKTSFSESLKIISEIKPSVFPEYLGLIQSTTRSISAMTDAYNQAIANLLPPIELSEVIKTALTGYAEQLSTLPKIDISKQISDVISLSISESVFSVADFYRPYMTEEQVEEIVEVVPEFTEPERQKKHPKISLEHLLWLIGFLVPLFVQFLPDPQLKEITNQNEQIIALEESAQESRNAEIALLEDLLSASEEFLDLLKESVHGVDPFSQEPDGLIKRTDDVIVGNNHVGDPSDAASKETNRNAENQNQKTE